VDREVGNLSRKRNEEERTCNSQSSVLLSRSTEELIRQIWLRDEERAGANLEEIGDSVVRCRTERRVDVEELGDDRLVSSGLHAGFLESDPSDVSLVMARLFSSL
jgi:hypothetical protein